jgi:hypothetical protein
MILYHGNERIINEYAAVGKLAMSGETEILGEILLQQHAPEILYDLTFHQTQANAAESWQLTS